MSDLNIAKVRSLLETMRVVAIHLTEEEISEIGKILLQAIYRMEKEQQ